MPGTVLASVVHHMALWICEQIISSGTAKFCCDSAVTKKQTFLWAFLCFIPSLVLLLPICLWYFFSLCFQSILWRFCCCFVFLMLLTADVSILQPFLFPRALIVVSVSCCFSWPFYHPESFHQIPSSLAASQIVAFPFLAWREAVHLTMGLLSL